MSVERNGPWLQTSSGMAFHPFDCYPEDFDIEDIAHALSKVARFGGHTKGPHAYSVAQHCVIVSTELEYEGSEHALEGLLHDASEAYLVDIPRPIKYAPGMEGYRMLESVLECRIAIQFKLAYPWPADVKAMDDIVLLTEKRDLMEPSDKKWEGFHGVMPLLSTITPWTPAKAKREFLHRFQKLKRK